MTPPPESPAEGAPLVDQEPVVATGSGAAWTAWLRHLLTAARGRLAGAGALLLGALVVGAAALWLFGAVADEVTEGETAVLDQGVASALRGVATPSLDEAARLVSALGSEVVAVLLVVLVGYFAWRRRWGAAASLVLITVGAQLLNNVLKGHFRRPRPAPLTGLIPAQAWSFPSGHAMVAAAFYLFLAYVGWRLLRGPARWAWTALLVTLVLLIDLSRLYLNAHYLTDVVAGNAVGLAWTAAVVGAGNLLALPRGPDRPPVRPPAGGLPGRGATAGLGDEAPGDDQDDAGGHQRRDEVVVDGGRPHEERAGRQDGDDAGGDLPGVADDEVVPEAEEPGHEVHGVSPRAVAP